MNAQNYSVFDFVEITVGAFCRYPCLPHFFHETAAVLYFHHLLILFLCGLIKIHVLQGVLWWFFFCNASSILLQLMFKTTSHF